MEDSRKIAIYSRKSKFTGKGESIESQIMYCKKELLSNYPDLNEDDIVCFEDEGYSGGNTNRPQFQKMMNECRNNQIKMIVFYKLDRISRNTLDFFKLYEELNKYHIEIFCASDKFETKTAAGKALMQITMVFAELERSAIAERIRDNMRYLAKDGRWLGGNTPTGYKSVATIGSISFDGRTRSAHMLELIDEEAEIIKLIFSKYLELNSLSKLETFLIQKDILTKQNNRFSRFAIRNILQNPVYLIADEKAWNYFKEAGTEIYSPKENFDGIHGMMVYNKTNQQVGKTNVINPINEWIIAVGKHYGIISGEDWVEVQRLLKQNKTKGYRKPRSSVALLSGLLYCEKCGSFMRPKLSQRRNKDGELIYDYLCELKEKSKGMKCDMNRPNGNELDRAVCEIIKKYAEPSTFLKLLENVPKDMENKNESYKEKIIEIDKTIEKYQKEIKNLVDRIAKNGDTPANKYITDDINTIHEKIESLIEQKEDYIKLSNRTTSSKEEFEILSEFISKASIFIDKMDNEQKRRAIRSIVHKVIWNGSTAQICIFGVENSEIDISDDEKSRAAASGLQTRY